MAIFVSEALKCIKRSSSEITNLNNNKETFKLREWNINNKLYVSNLGDKADKYKIEKLFEPNVNLNNRKMDLTTLSENYTRINNEMRQLKQDVNSQEKIRGVTESLTVVVSELNREVNQMKLDLKQLEISICQSA